MVIQIIEEFAICICPLMRRLLTTLRASRCIDFGKFAPSLQRNLREISDSILRQLAAEPSTREGFGLEQWVAVKG